jgi:hypothetical protein
MHPRHGRLASAVALASAVLVLAACAQPGSSGDGQPSGVAATSPAAIATPAPSPSIGPEATLPGQTDTAWGRIWDGIPYWFALPTGAEPTETGGGPASAVVDIGPVDPAAEATVTRGALQLSGMTASIDGPLENGSYVVSATGTPGCAVQVTIEPLGTTIIETVLYGAACPFELSAP